jgi:hypothetical protein
MTSPEMKRTTTETRQGWRYVAGIALCLALLMGGWLRISGLSARSITHPEMYVPNIPLPEGISEPAERVTVARILTGTFSSDTHPPGYYLLMFPWTRVVGTSLAAIRLPSALFGIASIALIFWFGSLTGWRGAGVLAAGLLAFSGFHVFWSQVARMFALECFLGLAASILLLRIAQSAERTGILTAIYVCLILTGLACHVFFWTLFGAHLIWTFSGALGRGPLPDVARAQLLALVLGSPLLAFSAYQSGNTVAELSDNFPLYASQFLSFAFALPTANSGFFSTPVPFTGGTVFLIVRGVLFLIGLGFFCRGLLRLWRSSSDTGISLRASAGKKFWILVWTAAAVVGTVEIAGFLFMVRKLPPEFINSSIRITRIFSILPFTFLALALLLDSRWGRLPARGSWRRLVTGKNGLIVLLATVPLLALATFSQFRPIMNQRGLLFSTPYLLLLLSIGVVTLQSRVWRAATGLVLALICAASLKSYQGMMVDPADYARFATAVKSEIRNGDLVFIRKAWYETPILYYLHKDRYNLVGRDYRKACAQNPDARVWVVMLYDSDPAKDMSAALAGYRTSSTLTGDHAKAILFEPPGGSISQTFKN